MQRPRRVPPKRYVSSSSRTWDHGIVTFRSMFICLHHNEANLKIPTDKMQSDRDIVTQYVLGRQSGSGEFGPAIVCARLAYPLRGCLAVRSARTGA
jgi:hypothetical protein